MYNTAILNTTQPPNPSHVQSVRNKCLWRRSTNTWMTVVNRPHQSNLKSAPPPQIIKENRNKIGRNYSAPPRVPPGVKGKGKQSMCYYPPSHHLFLIEPHTDRYNSKSKLEPSATPIPKVAYHTLKEKRLREMLSDHDLPTTGDKDTLIRRHERWVLVYNANLDRNPRDRETLEELIRKLKKWEDTRGGKKVGVGDVKAYEV